MKGGGGGGSGNRASERSFRDVEELGSPEITLASSSSPSRDPRGFPGRRGGSGIRWWHVGVVLIVLVNCGFIVKWDLLNASYSAATMGTKGSWMTMPEVNFTFTITKAPSAYGRSHHKGDHRHDTLGGGDSSSSSSSLEQLGSSKGKSKGMECTEEWLEEADAVTWAHRDFKAHPVLIIDHGNMDLSSCGVPCIIQGSRGDGPPDGTFGLQEAGVASILRSMESSAYYPENDVDTAHQKGFRVAMTTSLRSDVPVGYFSWAEYRIMEPPKPKTKKSLAAAFISNCGAHNDRLQAMEQLMKKNVSIDSYGACLRNVDGGRGVDKVEALQEYKFSLAFENSNVEDYVTEKFFQSLVAGAVPVVIGAPNIQDFAPGPNTVLHIKTLDDVSLVASQMKHMAKNDSAFKEATRWKLDGPSDSFLALVDMAAVHSTCRLCIHLATQIRLTEEAAAPKRPCYCTSVSGDIHHIYVRERGRFDSVSIFIKDSDLTEEGLKQTIITKFQDLNHVPVWHSERPKAIQGNGRLRIHRIYPVGLNQRQALYEWSIQGDEEVRKLVTEHPCPLLEVIFV